jgi:hypothetical protein
MKRKCLLALLFVIVNKTSSLTSDGGVSLSSSILFLVHLPSTIIKKTIFYFVLLIKQFICFKTNWEFFLKTFHLRTWGSSLSYKKNTKKITYFLDHLVDEPKSIINFPSKKFKSKKIGIIYPTLIAPLWNHTHTHTHTHIDSKCLIYKFAIQITHGPSKPKLSKILYLHFFEW